MTPLVLAGRSGSFTAESDSMSSRLACRLHPSQLDVQPLVVLETHVLLAFGGAYGMPRWQGKAAPVGWSGQHAARLTHESLHRGRRDRLIRVTMPSHASFSLLL